MSEIAAEHGVPLLVCTVASNAFRAGHTREWFFAGDGQDNHPRAFVEARWALRYGAPEHAVSWMRARLGDDENDRAARLILARALKAVGRKEAARAEYAELLRRLDAFPETERDDDAVTVRAHALSESEERRPCARIWIGGGKG
ncbi:MAG: hypothetical protein M5R36_05590 [Deltaproteobacteria bacterium]|nr:hypothetical protein [Deltaproteobacteria bacterium]